MEHGPHVAHGQWSDVEAKQSSTWRELEAVSRVLSAVVGNLTNSRVKWFSDNQNVVRILQVGSRKPVLQKLALSIFRRMIQHGIRLEPVWLPREENKLADYVSRIVESDDWSVHWSVYRWLDCLWGPHECDRFADETNTHCSRFNSRFLCPGTEAVDTFTVCWRGVINWVCPPVCLIPRVIEFIKRQGCKRTLVVPAWPSAVFWPLLFPFDGCYLIWVKDVTRLQWFEGMVVAGKSGACLPKSDLTAVEQLSRLVRWLGMPQVVTVTSIC